MIKKVKTRVDVLCGSSIREAVKESIELCEKEGLKQVIFDFNGCTMNVNKGSNVDALANYYGIYMGTKKEI